jgi:sulfofructose kinase
MRPPSAAIVVADDGERLVCAYNDPALDSDASRLPLERISGFAAVLADVRWPAGAAAVLGAAAAAEIPPVLDADIGPRDVVLGLAQRATHVVFPEPGPAQASGTENPGEGLLRVARSVRGVVGVTLGAEGFLWRDGDRARRMAAPHVAAIDTLAAGGRVARGRHAGTERRLRHCHGRPFCKLRRGNQMHAGPRPAGHTAAHRSERLVLCERVGRRSLKARYETAVERSFGNSSTVTMF